MSWRLKDKWLKYHFRERILSGGQGKIELKEDGKPKSEEDNNSIPKALLRQKSENEAFDVNLVHKEPPKNAALQVSLVSCQQRIK